MNIGICDDDELYLDTLYQMVMKLVSASSDTKVHKLVPNDLYEDIRNHKILYDILITDIDLGGFNGIEMVERINKINPACIIIFISSFINYATRVYDVAHVYFVLKTEADVRFPKALEKALTVYKEHKLSYLTISYHNVNYCIAHADISYIESLGRYLYIHTEKQTYKTIKTLTAILDELSFIFARCHKSFIINLDYVYSITRSNCLLKTEENIPISSTYSKTFLSFYRQYAMNKLD